MNPPWAFYSLVNITPLNSPVLHGPKSIFQVRHVFSWKGAMKPPEAPSTWMPTCARAGRGPRPRPRHQKDDHRRWGAKRDQKPSQKSKRRSKKKNTKTKNEVKTSEGFGICSRTEAKWTQTFGAMTKNGWGVDSLWATVLVLPGFPYAEPTSRTTQNPTFLCR